MEQKIKPIETVYKGYRFRSRLEARWAVFFDACGIEYKYEPEGFEADGGTRYLPDFYLPEFDCYAEVKSNMEESIHDINKCISMIKWGGPIKKILILSDIPGECVDGGMWHFPVLYWRDSGVVCGWWFFSDNGEGGIIGHVSSAPYISPFYCDESGARNPRNGVFSINAVSDYVLRAGSVSIRRYYNYDDTHNVREAIQFQLGSNEKVFNGFREARQARFEHGETPKFK